MRTEPVVDGKVKTVSGRWIPAPPALRGDTERKVQAACRKHEKWAKEQAVAEAAYRDDDWNLTLFHNMGPSLSIADYDLIGMYLFDTLEAVSFVTDGVD